MPAPANRIANSWNQLPKPCGSEHGLVHVEGCDFLLAEDDGKLPMLSEDPSSSHDSEGSIWHIATLPQHIPDGEKGVPCMADELELQAEEIEEQDPWAAEDDGGLRGSVSSLDSCTLSGPAPPAPLLQPAWAATAESAACLGDGPATATMHKPAASSFLTSDDSWDQESSVPICRTPVLGVRMRSVKQQRQAGASQPAPAPAQSWLAAAAAAAGPPRLQPVHPHSWRGCRKGPRCDREDRHRGVCNMRAAPVSAFAGSNASTDDATDGEALVPDALLSPSSSPYRAGALLQGPACCVAGLGCPSLSAPLLAPPLAAATLSPPPAVPLRQSQRRLKMAASEAADPGSQESAGDPYVRRSLGSRRGSSEILSDGSSFESSDDEEGDESQSFALRLQTLAQPLPARMFEPPASKRAASEHGRDLLDLVPMPKLPRCASASSVLQRPAAAARVARRTGPGRTASIAALVAAGRPRKRAGGGRGTGPLAATLPGQHCQFCHTQVTPVWRAGPGGPKTLCNACGVRYMKTSGRAKGSRG